MCRLCHKGMKIAFLRRKLDNFAQPRVKVYQVEGAKSSGDARLGAKRLFRASLRVGITDVVKCLETAVKARSLVRTCTRHLGRMSFGKSKQYINSNLQTNFQTQQRCLWRARRVPL